MEKIYKEDGTVDWFLTNQSKGLYKDISRGEDGTYDYEPKWEGCSIYHGVYKEIVKKESYGFLWISKCVDNKDMEVCIVKSAFMYLKSK